MAKPTVGIMYFEITPMFFSKKIKQGMVNCEIAYLSFQFHYFIGILVIGKIDRGAENIKQAAILDLPGKPVGCFVKLFRIFALTV